MIKQQEKHLNDLKTIISTTEEGSKNIGNEEQLNLALNQLPISYLQCLNPLSHFI